MFLNIEPWKLYKSEPNWRKLCNNFSVKQFASSWMFLVDTLMWQTKPVLTKNYQTKNWVKSVKVADLKMLFYQYLEWKIDINCFTINFSTTRVKCLIETLIGGNTGQCAGKLWVQLLGQSKVRSNWWNKVKSGAFDGTSDHQESDGTKIMFFFAFGSSFFFAKTSVASLFDWKRACSLEKWEFIFREYSKMPELFGSFLFSRFWFKDENNSFFIQLYNCWVWSYWLGPWRKKSDLQLRQKICSNVNLRNNNCGF